MTEFVKNIIKDNKNAIKARKKIRRKMILKAKIREIKRVIRREIAIELHALKILAPIFGGAIITFALLVIFIGEINILHNLIHMM